MQPITYKTNYDKPIVPVKAGVVDNYDEKTRDINNDGYPDISHGAMVEATLRGNLKYQPSEVIQFKVKKLEDKEILKALQDANSTPGLKAVNISIGSQTNYPLPKNICETPNLTKLNLSKSNPILYRCIRTLEEIAKKSEVFVGAGNDGPDGISLLTFADGVNVVGSMSMREKTTRSDFSADNPLTNIFAQGEYDIRAIMENGTVIGYDITEDGIMDIPISAISGHEVIERFVGKNIDDVKANVDDYKKLSMALANIPLTPEDEEKLKGKLFPIGSNFIHYNSMINLEKNKEQLKQGKPCISPTLAFKVDDRGKVIYNPYKEDKFVRKLKGTSYAAPTAMAQYLNGYIEENNLHQSQK